MADTANSVGTNNHLEILKKRGFEQNISLLTLCRKSYEGGTDYIDSSTLFTHPREYAEEYAARLLRAYFFNYTAPIVDTYQFFLFKGKITRSTQKDAKEVNAFIVDCDRNGKSLDEFSKELATELIMVGRSWIVVDAPNVAIETKAQEQELGVRPYVYTIATENVLDYAEDKYGKLLWIKYVADVSTKSGGYDYDGSGSTTNYTVWSRESIDVYDAEGKVIKKTPWGKDIPIVQVKFGNGSPFIKDIAITNRSLFNWCSLLDEILYRQTFSQLIVPQDANQALKEKAIGTAHAWTFDPQAKHVPQYISPDVGQATFLMTWIKAAIAEIYRTANLDWSSTSLPNTSGIAKAYDFMNINKNLAALALSLNNAEKSIFALFQSFYSDGNNERYMCSVQYPTEFAYIALTERLDQLYEALTAGISKKFNELIKKQIVENVLPMVSPEDKNEIFKEIETLTAEEELISVLFPPDTSVDENGETTTPPGKVNPKKSLKDSARTAERKAAGG